MNMIEEFPQDIAWYVFTLNKKKVQYQRKLIPIKILRSLHKNVNKK